MVSLSAPLTQAGHADRLLLAGIPAAAALLPTLDSAHHQLLITQPSATVPERAAAIIVEERTLDLRHDAILRGCFTLLQALSYLTTNADEAKLLIELQHVLLPEGLVATQKTYREEAGQAALLESRLTPAHRALLTSIKTLHGTTLWDSVQEWMHLGKALGKLEDERGGGLETTRPTAAEGLAARNRWIRTINAILGVLDLVEADEPGVTAILSRIAEAERRADRRGEGAEAAPAVEVAVVVLPVEEARKTPGDG